MRKMIPLLLALATASALMAAGCTMTENEVTRSGSGVSAHIEFKF